MPRYLKLGLCSAEVERKRTHSRIFDPAGVRGQVYVITFDGTGTFWESGCELSDSESSSLPNFLPVLSLQATRTI